MVDFYGKRFAVCLIVPGFLSAVMLLNDSEGLQQLSCPYDGLIRGRWFSPIGGCLCLQPGGPVGDAQANFSVLMGKEGMVTIVTGLRTV